MLLRLRQRKTAPNLRPSQVRVHPVKVILIIQPPSVRIKKLLDNDNRTSVCAATAAAWPDIQPEKYRDRRKIQGQTGRSRFLRLNLWYVPSAPAFPKKFFRRFHRAKPA